MRTCYFDSANAIHAANDAAFRPLARVVRAIFRARRSVAADLRRGAGTPLCLCPRPRAPLLSSHATSNAHSRGPALRAFRRVDKRVGPEGRR